MSTGPGTSNEPHDHHGPALGFRNPTNYIISSLLEPAASYPAHTLICDEPLYLGVVVVGTQRPCDGFGDIAGVAEEGFLDDKSPS